MEASTSPEKDKKSALREGDSLRARYFRWKDESLKDVPSSSVSQSGLTGPDNMAVFTKVSSANQALIAAPEDQAAFDAAVQALDEMLTVFKAHGLPVNTDVRP